MSCWIDRASFLSLTFGMAGLACNTGPSPVVAANVVDIPPQPTQPGDAGVPIAIAPKPNDPSAGPLAVSEPPLDDDSEDDVGFNVTEGAGAPGPSALGGGKKPQVCGFVDPKTVTRPAAPCTDDGGTAPSCTIMKVCSGFAFPKEQCASYRRLFKPKVASMALDCLAKLSTKQTCDDACNTYHCGDLALKTACPDPSADAQCTQITTKCASVSMNDCRTYLSGLNAAGRAKMVTCITSKSGCGYGLFSCSESL